MVMASKKPIHEESLWFGDPERPIFGRLAAPTGGTALGGVLISPPVGRELRLSRRALRTLAVRLALDGYVSLRFDHFGSGDSSGTLDDDKFDFAWVDGVAQGVSLLRSLGMTSISAVGMRMGATIVGKAASESELGLTSFVMWDPCESGRSYVRELGALGALQRDVVGAEAESASKMMEFPVSDKTAERLKTFSLTNGARPPAQRSLIIVRDDRPVSRKFRARWDSAAVTWSTTSDQATLFENSLPYAIQPESTIEEIRSWLTAADSVASPLTDPSNALGAVIATTSRAFPVRESLVSLGPNNLFGIVSEPLDDVQGPLIVMVNGVHEDHVGPARLWVELSRRWASAGLRCVRFDLRELGESPWFPGLADRPVFDKTRAQDIVDAIRALNPTSPSDSVLIGYCSGAQLALEVALELDSRGACAISPEVVASVFRNVDRVKYSRHGPIRDLVGRIENFLKRHRWEGRMSRRFSRVVRSMAYPPRIGMALVKRHSEVLLLLGPEDLPRFPRIPILRRRLQSSKHHRVEIVPGMDHNLLSTLGRDRAVVILNEYILDTFVEAVPPSETNPNSSESSSR
jgi:dienelactone hydrolase